MLKSFIDPSVLSDIQEKYKEEKKEYVPEDNSYISTQGMNKIAGWNPNQNIVESVEQLDESVIKSNNIKAGEHYHMKDAKGNVDHVRFNGWTDDDKQYGTGGAKFNHIKDIPGATSIPSLEAKAAGKEHGYSHYAHFTAMKDDEPDYDFHAYPYKGRLAVGTSADHVSFHKIEK